MHSQKLTRQFCATIQTCEEKSRISNLQGESINNAEKKRALEILASHTCESESDPRKQVKIIRGWYGTNTEIAKSIFSSGFPVVDGRFGHGIYFSTNPEYLFLFSFFILLFLFSFFSFSLNLSL